MSEVSFKITKLDLTQLLTKLARDAARKGNGGKFKKKRGRKQK